MVPGKSESVFKVFILEGSNWAYFNRRCLIYKMVFFDDNWLTITISKLSQKSKFLPKKNLKSHIFLDLTNKEKSYGSQKTPFVKLH